MEYTKKDLGSFKLHLIKTDKFKTITIRVIFHTPIKKEDTTKRSVLSDILLQSSKKYESRRKLTIEAEELYAADISNNNQRLGNYIFTTFNLQVLNDKYTEENNLEKSLEFLSEIIYNPDIESKSFKKDKLDIVKYNTVVNLSSIKEDASSYSLIRMAESFDINSPVSYRISGYLEDLEKIDEENLYKTYKEMIDNDFVDIFVVGNYDNEEMLMLIKKYFKFKKIKKEKETYFLKSKKISKKIKVAKETISNTQSKLAIACPISKLTDYERNYSLVLANLILGGGTDSKLFKEVREKNSLCYTIRSMINKLDNLLIIFAGIDKNNYEKTLELIKKNLENMKRGKFTEKDIEVAKQFYYTSQEEVEESENRMINEVLSQELLGLAPIDERIKIIEKVTKKDIIKVCKKINIDTVFLLEGVKNEKD